MPIFEYRCTDCSREFEAIITGERRPECPACRSANLEKLLSSPGMVGASAGPARAVAPMSGGCGGGGAHCACRAGQN